MTSVEDRYLAGDLDFETAAAAALGAAAIDRQDLVPILRALSDATHPASGLSASDAALLDAGGAPQSPVALAAAVADRQARMRELLKSALTVEQAAERLGVSTSRVRQRAGDRSLWSIKRAHRLLLPAIQFTERGQIPGLDVVLTELPEDVQPLSVLGLLTTPQPDLRLDDAEVSIIDWLTSGGAPTPT
ncbi:DNA-binding protein, partial [Rhodococcus olei]|uniref:DNA-binding protein n=1 Tax=Rhodococcus olei TaxID=2161675 RepID=UPI0031E55FC7